MRFVACALSTAAAALLLTAGPAAAGTVVPVPAFDGVGLNGGGHVVIKYGATQQVTILKGSTKYTEIKVKRGGGLEIDACNWSCPNHYDLEIEIVTPNINAVAIHGGGEIDSAGGFSAVREVSVAVHGGGTIDLRSIAADNVNAAVNGGGDIKVTAHRSLNAAVSGGGDIAYWGHPSVSSAVSGGGDVHSGS